MSRNRKWKIRVTPEEKAQMNMELLPEYGRVQVYKDTFDLLVKVYQHTATMNRAYRFTLGEEMKLTLQELLTGIYEARNTTPRSPFIADALHWCYKAKVLYRVMDSLSLLKTDVCVSYIQGLASISKQLTNWYKFERRREKAEKEQSDKKQSEEGNELPPNDT